MTEQRNSTPDIAIDMAIDDLVEEAKNFADGSDIETQGQADAFAKLIGEARSLRKAAEDARIAEKKPHDDAGKAVQAKYKPITAKADTLIETLNTPLTKWLEKVAAEQRAEAERLRVEAEHAAQEAARLAGTAQEGDLSAALDIEAARAKAAKAEKIANRAGNQKAHVHGGGRAMALRTSWEAELVDPVAALKWAKERHPEELKAWLLQEAQRDVNAGVRSIAGFVIHERKKAA